jgi:hypothetical protein
MARPFAHVLQEEIFDRAGAERLLFELSQAAVHPGDRGRARNENEVTRTEGRHSPQEPGQPFSGVDHAEATVVETAPLRPLNRTGLRRRIGAVGEEIRLLHKSIDLGIRNVRPHLPYLT